VIVDEVTTVTTPGEVIDVVVTDRGIAVNPRREELRDRLAAAGLPVRTLEEIQAEASRLVQPVGRPVFGEEVIAAIEWRDGTVIDVVRKVEGWA
jgi:citrate lyase subunit alpha/citrate CoA-transferase